MNRRIPVFIAGTNCLSGVTTWAEQLSAALTDHHRYDVRLLHIDQQDKSSGLATVVATIEEASSLVRSAAPAIVIPNYVWPLFLTGLEPGVRCVGVCHADDVAQYHRPLSWYEPAITKFIAVSRECTEKLHQFIPCRTEDVTTLPYGVHVPSPLNRTYQAKPLRLIYAGRVTQPQKRVWDFVPLVENLLRAKVPFVFDIVGGGDEFEPLKQMMHARIPAADVRFHPRVPHAQMPSIWLEHDIFVQVSDFEGTSVSMLEAMAHGVVPVVTAASSGIADVITSKDNGFVVPIGDMAAMSACIAQLAEDATLLKSVGRAAYGTAQAYAMDLYARKFVQFLDEVMNERHVDYHKRYGIFSPTHPLFLQRQQLEKQLVEIPQVSSERPTQRRLADRLRNLRRRGGDKQAA